jgi:thiol-disulfide isomerase/thioredoxin
MKKTVISNFNSIEEYNNVLKTNPGIFIVKFSAKWCKPCQAIKPVVDGVFCTTPDTVVCADIDIDEIGNKDIYNALKNKRMIAGVPTLMMYKQGNTNMIVPDEVVSGSSAHGLHIFFTRCGNHLKSNAAMQKEITI